MTSPEKPGVEYLSSVEALSGDNMNHTFEAEKNLRLIEAAKKFPLIILWSIAAGSAGLLFGYDTVVNGASISMPAFELYFGAVTSTGKLYLPSNWTALWTSMSALLQCIGSFGAGPISDRIGRRYSVIGASFISASGIALQYAADSRGMLLAGKMVNGLAIGIVLTTATAWASEISPIRLRGPVQSGIVLLTVLMQAFSLLAIRQNVTNIEPHAFRLVFAIQWAFCSLTGLLFFFVPESPVWLVLSGREDQAKISMRRLYGRGEVHEERLVYLQRQIHEEAAAEHANGIGGFLELYKGSVLKRTLTVHLLFFGIGLAGSSFLAQSIYFLILAGLPAVHTFDVSIGGFILALFTIVASWIYLERVGRRSLWLIGVTVNMVVMVIIGALYYAKGKGPLWAVAILMNVLIPWEQTTLTSVAFVIAAEIAPYRLRAKNQSLAVLSNAFTTWLFNFTVPYMYNVDSGDLGARTGFVFAAGSLLLLIASYPLVPDLRGFSTIEIDWLYEQKLPVRKFQEYMDGRAARGAIEAGLEPGKEQAI